MENTSAIMFHSDQKPLADIVISADYKGGVIDERSVFQPWLSTITWKMQTVIITGIRGCDGLTKFDASKHLSRAIRSVALKNADSTTTYMNHKTEEELMASTKTFVDDMDRYPLHSVQHVMLACEIIGYKHPDEHTRQLFSAVYNQIVWAMHLRPEPEAGMDHRLADKREKKPFLTDVERHQHELAMKREG